MDRIARIAPSARLEQQIEELLTDGLGDKSEHLAELGRLGARLVLQRAVDEEVAAFLSRARYERTPTATGSRNGTRSKPIQTAEGEISIAMPQVRNTAERFVSQVIPDTKAVVRTRPLEALILWNCRLTGATPPGASPQNLCYLGMRPSFKQSPIWHSK
jgi:putative transposase